MAGGGKTGGCRARCQSGQPSSGAANKGGRAARVAVWVMVPQTEPQPLDVMAPPPSQRHGHPSRSGLPPAAPSSSQHMPRLPWSPPEMLLWISISPFWILDFMVCSTFFRWPSICSLVWIHMESLPSRVDAPVCSGVEPAKVSSLSLLHYIFFLDEHYISSSPYWETQRSFMIGVDLWQFSLPKPTKIVHCGCVVAVLWRWWMGYLQQQCHHLAAVYGSKNLFVNCTTAPLSWCEIVNMKFVSSIALCSDHLCQPIDLWLMRYTIPNDRSFVVTSSSNVLYNWYHSVCKLASQICSLHFSYPSMHTYF
jgi:hypothetical protein